MSDTAYEPCLACGEPLFKKNRLPTGGWAMDPQEKLDLETVEGESFFRCPHCGRRNMVVQTTQPGGLPGIKISHLGE